MYRFLSLSFSGSYVRLNNRKPPKSACRALVELYVTLVLVPSTRKQHALRFPRKSFILSSVGKREALPSSSPSPFASHWRRLLHSPPRLLEHARRGGGEEERRRRREGRRAKEERGASNGETLPSFLRFHCP